MKYNNFKNIVDDDDTNFTKPNIEVNLAWAAVSNSDETKDRFKREATVVMKMAFEIKKFAKLDEYQSEADLTNFLSQPGQMDRRNNSIWLCGIVLEDLGDTGSVCSKNFQMTLRFPATLRSQVPASPYVNWRTNLLFPMYQMDGPREKNKTHGATPGYFQEGFLTVQYFISSAVTAFCFAKDKGRDNLCIIYKNCTSDENTDLDPGYNRPPISTLEMPRLLLQRFSYPEYVEDPLLEALQGFISLMIMLSFVYSCIATVKIITTEKERQLKEAMKIMGLPGTLHWTAWFIKIFFFLLISVLLMVVLLKARWYPGTDTNVFQNSEATLLFVFMAVYMVATTFFCFMISVFFTKANTAATIAGLAWFLTYAPYSFMQQKYETLSLGTKLSSSLCFNTAMAFGFQLVVMAEGAGEGMKWSNMWEPITVDDNLNLGQIIIMLLVDSVLYLVIALYVEAVFPGDYGVPKPWYFFVQKSFWCGSKRSPMNEDVVSANDNGSNFEKEPTKTNAGVQIRNLRKVFNKDKVAVNNLSLNMYEGQITVLLGHNGAGKTTTMSMLTGMFTPTSGTALVSGYDIITDIENVRDSLGLCPQHNVLFDELTVHEHLYFFGKLKGMSGKELKSEIKRFVELLELQPKEHAQSHTLSGGMKRKLAAGVALCGKSKVVMFDEPTSGMDPAARRALWDLLQREKQGRTMLLTTHFMDEADLLGDRIAIMAGGKLQCCGSSFFLKKRYGAGYLLVVVKGPRCDSLAVTALLRRHLPDISPTQDVGSELSYQLDESQSSLFEPMLRELEEARAKLDVLSYGVSLTTMEEVFMKAGKDQEVTVEDIGKDKKYPKIEDNFMGENPLYNSYKVQINDGKEDMMTGFNLTLQRLFAMLLKKFLAYKRGWLLYLIQCILPLFFLIIIMLVAKTWQSTRDLPEREIDLKSYSESYTAVSAIKECDKKAGLNITVDIPKSLCHMYENYREIVKNQTGGDIIHLEGSDNSAAVFDNYILERYRNATIETRHTNIVGASFGVENKVPVIRGWFNDLPYHAAPLSLNMLMNAILYAVDASIKLINFPLPFSPESKAFMLQMGNNMGFQIAFNIGFSMAFVSAYYVMFLVKERMSKAKHLQFVSGVEVFTFWLAHLTCDGLSFVVPSVGAIITLAAFQEPGFDTAEHLGRMFCIFIFFGWAMLPLMYLSSFLFTIPSSGYTRMTMFNIFLGIAAFMVVTILQIPDLDLQDVADVLDWILLVVPHYCMADAIQNSYMNWALLSMSQNLHINCSAVVESVLCPDRCPEGQLCPKYSENYFKWEQPGIGRNLVYFLVGGCVFNLLLLLIEFRVLEFLRPSRKYQPKVVAVQVNGSPPLTSLASSANLHEGEDSDVLHEKERIRTTPTEELNSQFSLVLRDVTKYYGRFLAVDHICIGVKRGECFGLLGVNGAGKTTTFKMMTGDEKISEGDGYLNGLSLKSEQKEVHQLIGYCPQFDALIEEMTGRETLQMFCLLRGIRKHNIPEIVDRLSDELLFKKHIDKKVKEYSGGNKRKLSTAVALVGDPPVVFLDEPTTGMDPVAKRHLWNVICKVRDSGKSIILTSHSMEECEALCTRLAIMVNGNFKCLGSTQHLKNKFAEGFTLQIKVGASPVSSGHSRTLSITSMDSLANSINPTKEFVSTSFPGAILREEYMGLLTYYIPKTNLAWSQMFGMMEDAKRKLNIEDYSLGQTSLEQVFLTFTKAQKSEIK